MNNSPLVCICVPTYNAESTVRETLISILEQSYTNIVIHISDNASTDKTLSIIEEINNPRIIIHRNETNVGGEGNFTRCIKLATGKYTAIFHADDIYEKEMVSKQVFFLENNVEVGAVFTNADIIDSNGVFNGRYIGIPNNEITANNIYDFEYLFKAVLRHSNFFVCPSAMVRTKIYCEVIKDWNGLDFGTSADLDVWFRLSLNSVIGILPERLMRYRISEIQHTQKLRSRTTRSDIFLVLDYYLQKDNVKFFMSSTEWLNFGRLERTDRIVRAANLYVLGKQDEAVRLCTDALSKAAFRSAAINKRGFLTFLAGIILRVLIYIDLPRLGQPLIRSLKRYTGK
jgi:glycosyltransferase involved in cell wall biosynthesis